MSTPHVGFAQEPSGRGTIGLVWSCLSTLFICVWTSLHLNVANKGRGRLYYATRKAGWAVGLSFFPEVASSAAACDWAEARRGTRLMRRAGVDHWTDEHSFLTNMGGIRFVNEKCLRTGDEHCSREGWVGIWGLEEAAKQGMLPRELMDLTRDDIQRRSKADGLVKLIACGQILWFLAQCLGRVAQGLPLTALEVAMPAFIICALLNYGLWFFKPLDDPGLVAYFSCIKPDGGHLRIALESHQPPDLEFALSLHRKEGREFLTLALFVAFGAIHCAAWNVNFPSQVEQVMWRVASIVSMVSPVVQFVVDKGPDETAPSCLRFLNLVVYFAARLFPVVDMFASLRYLPEDCYKNVDWSNFLPHIG